MYTHKKKTVNRYTKIKEILLFVTENWKNKFILFYLCSETLFYWIFGIINELWFCFSYYKYWGKNISKFNINFISNEYNNIKIMLDTKIDFDRCFWYFTLSDCEV